MFFTDIIVYIFITAAVTKVVRVFVFFFVFSLKKSKIYFTFKNISK